MHNSFRPSRRAATLTLVLSLAGVAFATPQKQVSPSPLIGAMETELQRSMDGLKKVDPPPYFMAYTIVDQQNVQVQGSNGALLESQDSRARYLEVQVRVGSYDLDNTHRVGDRSGGAGGGATALPIDNDLGVIRRAIWLETDRQYHDAAEALIKIQTGKEVKVQTAEGEAPDFSREEPQKWFGPEASIHVDRRPWEERVRLYTAAFRKSAKVFNSIVTFTARATNQYQVNTEGTRLQFGDVHYRLELYIQGKAPDGMDINRYYNYDWVDPSEAPDDKAVLEQCADLTKRAGHAFRTRRGRLLPRSVRPPRRGAPAEGHQRGPDVHAQSGRSHHARLHLHL